MGVTATAMNNSPCVPGIAVKTRFCNEYCTNYPGNQENCLEGDPASLQLAAESTVTIS